jgi:hypothetical protein
MYLAGRAKHSARKGVCFTRLPPTNMGLFCRATEPSHLSFWPFTYRLLQIPEGRRTSKKQKVVYMYVGRVSSTCVSRICATAPVLGASLPAPGTVAAPLPSAVRARVTPPPASTCSGRLQLYRHRFFLPSHRGRLSTSCAGTKQSLARRFDA